MPFLHHRSSGAYSTLRSPGILKLPSERTLRDYRHFAPAVVGFSTDTDKQLMDMMKTQQPAELAKYVSIVIDEMYIKEGLIFNKHNGCLIGFQDLGDTNNLLAEYENHHNENEGMFLRRPLARTMVVFMVQGLFTSLKFPMSNFLLQVLKKMICFCCFGRQYFNLPGLNCKFYLLRAMVFKATRKCLERMGQQRVCLIKPIITSLKQIN